MKAKTQTRPASKRKAPAKSARPAPAVLYRDGKPAFVLLDIRAYEDMLDRLDELDDIAYIEELRKKPLKFRPLEEYLAEHEGK